VRNVHVRFEDKESIPGTQFAAGVTFSSFSSHANSGSAGALSALKSLPPISAAAAAASASASVQEQRRVAELALFSLYWEPLALNGPFSALAPSEITSAFSRGITTRDGELARHCYVMAPSSLPMHVDITRRSAPALAAPNSPGASAAIAAALEASVRVSELELSVSRTQLLQVSHLARWAADQASSQLRNELRVKLRPSGGLPSQCAPAGAWKPVWRYAFDFVTELRRRQTGRQPRWDCTRATGSVKAYCAYIKAYSALVSKEAALLASELQAQVRNGRGAFDPSAVLNAADTKFRGNRDCSALLEEVKTLEKRMIYEQIVDCRLEARLQAEAKSDHALALSQCEAAAEADAAAAASAPRGFIGWLFGGNSGAGKESSTSQSVHRTPHSPGAAASPTPASDGSQRREELIRMAFAKSSGESVLLKFSVDFKLCRLKLGGAAARIIPAANPLNNCRDNSAVADPETLAAGFESAYLLAVEFTGSHVECAVRTNQRWSLAASMESVRAFDGASVGTAFRRFVGPVSTSALTVGREVAFATSPDVVAAHPFMTCSAEQMFLGVRRGSIAHSITRIRIESQPLEVILVPNVMRGLASFAHAASAIAQTTGIAAGELKILAVAIA
jgi:hypothetical protein